jgi:hypothetical protein
MPSFIVTPQDVLFFRDGRPMEAGAGSGGHGARWPAPSILFDAMHAALHRAFPEIELTPGGQPAWEHSHHHGRSSDRQYDCLPAQRFGSLATAGPFPCVCEEAGSQWLFSCPSDVTKAGPDALEVLEPIFNAGGSSNLPSPLRYPLGNRSMPSKDEPKPWWSKAAIEAYLKAAPPLGETFWEKELWETRELFSGEWATGIGIDPERQTQDGQRIYSAEYLRLRDGVGLGLHATMPMKNGHSYGHEERLTKLFPACDTILVGGQQRACQVKSLAGDLKSFLPISAEIPKDATRVKWVLLSPSVFPAINDRTLDGKPKHDKNGNPIQPHPGGWLPNWVHAASGQVLLKKGDTTRQDGESREAWRTRINDPVRHPFLECRLRAACVPKPVVLTGWTEALHLGKTPWAREHGPRPALFAIPAGAVYYFEGPGASELSDALSWHGNPAGQDFGHAVKNRRSALLGEKGYGLGVCGTWKPFGDVR